MRLLIDTHLLLWASEDLARLPPEAAQAMADPDNTLIFSAVNIWEIVVKRNLQRPDFNVDPKTFRHRLLAAGYSEIDVTSRHTMGLAGLPSIHRDPFDRLLLAQAVVEEARLVTADATLARYPGPILKV